MLIINLIFLILSGLLLGYEREKSHKIIGIRSTILVLLGSFIYSFISTQIGGDPARIISQIVCGSGFIGAGIIFKKGGSPSENKKQMPISDGIKHHLFNKDFCFDQAL